MFSILCITSSKGDVLAYGQFRDDISTDRFERLVQQVTETKTGILPPVIKYEDVICSYINRENVFFMALTKAILSTFTMIEFLERFHRLVKDFCGAVSEDAVQQNICLVQELMNEILDFGYIQLTRTEQLRPFIFSDPVTPKKFYDDSDPVKSGLFGLERPVVPASAANRPVVRPRVIQDYRQSEIFLSVIERITAHIKADGTVGWFQLTGSIQMNSFLPGSPLIKIALNEDLITGQTDSTDSLAGYTTGIRLDQCSFQECVKSNGLQSNNTFQVQPPQGEVTIMTYQMGTLPTRLPFRVVSAVMESKTNSDLDLVIRIWCDAPLNAEAVNVTIHIPVPSRTTSCMQQFNIPDYVASFNAAERKVKWQIKKFPGQAEAVAKFKLIEANSTPASKLELGPIAIEFELSNFVCSNIAVRSIHVEHAVDSLRQIKKWVRYATTSDSYTIKLGSSKADELMITSAQGKLQTHPEKTKTSSKSQNSFDSGI